MTLTRSELCARKESRKPFCSRSVTFDSTVFFSPFSMTHVLAIAAVAFVLLLASIASSVGAQPASPTTAEIFKQFSEHVVRIEVVETASAAKASVGTGFFASSRGHIVTNYHVVSKLIHSPDRYRIEVTGASALTGPAEVLGVDVVYDLAVLRSNNRPNVFQGHAERRPRPVLAADQAGGFFSLLGRRVAAQRTPLRCRYARLLDRRFHFRLERAIVGDCALLSSIAFDR